MVQPHGGKLVDQVVPKKAVENLKTDSTKYSSIEISEEAYIELENIAIGTFSPLKGYVGEEEFTSIVERGRTLTNLPWTIPIVLDISKKENSKLKQGDQVTLSYEGKPVGIIDFEESFEPKKSEWAQKIFGTKDKTHPGVASINKKREILLGGTIELLEKPEVPFPNYRLTPKETRVLFKIKGWRTVVGFQTRNAPHIGHEYVQKTALTFVDGLFINPVIGRKKKGDFKDEVILAAYQELLDNYYLKDHAVLATLLTEMRYAGPKEAIHHAILRKNFGCSHFIVGRDHAGVGNYYPPYAAQEIFEEYPDLGIFPVFFRSFSHCKKCGTVVNEKICPHPEEEHINFSGELMREMLLQKKRPPEEQMRPEVADVILKFDRPFFEEEKQ